MGHLDMILQLPVVELEVGEAGDLWTHPILCIKKKARETLLLQQGQW